MKIFNEYKEDRALLEKLKHDEEIKLCEQLNGMLSSDKLTIVNEHGKWSVEAGQTGYDLIRMAMQRRIDESTAIPDTSGNIPTFTEFRGEAAEGLDYLTEAENTEMDRWVKICEDEYAGNPMDEGFLSKLVGGVAGFLIGPTVGRVIARTLGVEKGVLYDMFTSRIVSATLGVALAKQFGGDYKD